MSDEEPVERNDLAVFATALRIVLAQLVDELVQSGSIDVERLIGGLRRTCSLANDELVKANFSFILAALERSHLLRAPTAEQARAALCDASTAETPAPPAPAPDSGEPDPPKTAE